MPPLPPVLPGKFNKYLNYYSAKSAYDKCLLAQDFYESQLEPDPDTRLALICVRIVGYILHQAPSEAGVATLVSEIVSCKDHAALRELGSEYLRAWTRAFKGPNGQTPPPSGDTSPPSFDTLTDMINCTSDLAPQSHASAKRSALARDGYHCMITQKYDRLSVASNLELRGINLGSKDITKTECAHIFSETTNLDIEPGSNQRKRAASMWAVMSPFGYTTLLDDLNGTNIHRLENILTLDATMHDMFDSLELWFVATDIENWGKRKHIYNAEVSPPNEIWFGKYLTVTFESTARDELPLPSPEYLAIHAACCKIASLSGASEWLQEFEHGLDEHLHKTLANDGTSAHLLYSALCVHALAGGTMA